MRSDRFFAGGVDRAAELGLPDVLDPSTAKPIGTVALGGTADATMKDVAEHARVVGEHGVVCARRLRPVAPERRNRVLDAVQVLEYPPNESPRNLTRRSASTLGMVESGLSPGGQAREWEIDDVEAEP